MFLLYLYFFRPESTGPIFLDQNNCCFLDTYCTARSTNSEVFWRKILNSGWWCYWRIWCDGATTTTYYILSLRAPPPPPWYRHDLALVRTFLMKRRKTLLLEELWMSSGGRSKRSDQLQLAHYYAVSVANVDYMNADDDQANISMMMHIASWIFARYDWSSHVLVTAIMHSL